MLSNDKRYYEEGRAKNFINGLTRDDILYRYFPLDRFLKMLSDRQWALVKFSEWEDPFENFVYSAQVTSKAGIPVDLTNLRDSVFGQCWSLHQETDALWRIYSPNKSAVKVRVRASALFDSLYGTGEGTVLHLFFGKVMYKCVADIEALMKDQAAIHKGLFSTDGAGMIEYLLVKREEFSHENEARLIYQTETRDPRNKDKMLIFPLDPNSIVEEVVLDPRLSDSDATQTRNKIKAAGFVGDVRKSDLYAPPRFTFTLDV